MYNRFKNKIQRDEALKKAMKFCAYRERCAHEMEQKLHEWGLDKKEADQIVDELVENNFINHNRFLSSYCRGKFMNNHWGRTKIRVELKKKAFTDAEITEALARLDEGEYRKVAKRIMEKKSEKLDVSNRKERSKLYYFMLSKGYEPDVVIQLLNELN